MNIFFRFCFVTVIAAVAMMGMSCGGGGQKNAGQPKTKEQVEAKLKNFSISLVTESDEQEPMYFKQIACDKGAYFEMEGGRRTIFTGEVLDYHSIDFIDFTANKAYDLDPRTKTVKVTEFTDDKAARYRGFSMVMGQYLFMHEGHDNLVKTGKDKIAGRDATVYTIAYDDVEFQKFWIDDEYGFTLKFEQYEPLMKAYVTEFIVGSVSIDGLVDLSEYQEGKEAEVAEEPEIVEGVLSIAAMKKAAADAGFTVSGGWQIHSNYEGTFPPDPEGGFCIFMPIDGSNVNVINVVEFETEDITKKYAEYLASDDVGVSQIVHRSGVFVAYISKSRAADHEAKFMDALKTAGWE
jgi:hypothetical protein